MKNCFTEQMTAERYHAYRSRVPILIKTKKKITGLFIRVVRFIRPNNFVGLQMRFYCIS
jgi:hypothetical protein